MSIFCFPVAIAALKEREPGAFLIRDSNSFQGAYGLALKVAIPPANVNNHSSKGMTQQLPEHFAFISTPYISSTQSTSISAS